VIKVTRILKDYDESGALSPLVNVHAALDDHTFLTKSGDLIMTLRLEGPDAECRDAAELDQISRRFESALRVLDDGCRIYQYLIKRDNAPIPARSYNDAIVQEAVNSRLAHFQNKAQALYSLENYLAVSYEGWEPHGNRLADFIKTPVSNLRQALSSQQTVQALTKGLDQARERLHHKVMSFVVQLPDEIHATILDKQQAFAFVRRLLNYAPYKADSIRLKYDRFVDYQACDSALECYPDHLRLDNFYVRVLTLKEPPGQTFAHLLGGLEKIPCNFVIASEWKRESAAKMRSLIQAKRRHFHNSKSSFANYLAGNGSSSPANMLIDDSAVGVVAELGACLQEIDLQGHAFGECSMTALFYSEDDATVRRALAECFKVFATHDARLTEERYNLLNAWLAMLPGNHAYNLRRLWLLDTNYADLSFLFTLNTGERQNAHLGSEYLAVFETEIGTPYFFNLHYQDIAAAAVFGASGSGKSFLLNFLLTHMQKYQPLTYIFDLGGSYENLTRLFGGAYLPVGIEKRPFTINPFSLPPTPENLHFLFAFLKVLIESDTFRMNSDDESDLYSQLENLYEIDSGQRQLSTLANMLKRNLRVQLQKWTQGGPYENVFDNAEDNLTFASFQTFDFEGMGQHPEALEALLFYILHRANAAIADPSDMTRFKVFVIDEAWRFFRHPTIRQYILEALKTWRKKNAGVILATQSSDDLLRSEILPVVVESCPTKMFLANPDMDRKTYREIFHLNETEADLIAHLIPKQQILIKRPDGSKVVNLHVSPKDYWLYTSNPNDRQRRNDAFAQYGFKEGLEILASLPAGRQGA
jgi:type IV secretion/conjugal transfer VirB4 family ATPase